MNLILPFPDDCCTPFFDAGFKVGSGRGISRVFRAISSAYDHVVKVVGVVEKGSEFGEVSASADTYAQAKNEVIALVQEGWKLISLRVDKS